MPGGAGVKAAYLPTERLSGAFPGGRGKRGRAHGRAPCPLLVVVAAARIVVAIAIAIVAIAIARRQTAIVFGPGGLHMRALATAPVDGADEAIGRIIGVVRRAYGPPVRIEALAHRGERGAFGADHDKGTQRRRETSELAHGRFSRARGLCATCAARGPVLLTT